MAEQRRRMKDFRYVGLLLILTLCTMPAFALAQTAYNSTTIQKLKTPVHFNLGRTTIEAIAKSLSEQTGLTIESVDYLQGHKLIVQIDGLSALDALDTLVELNDWQWRETSKEHIVISRAVARRPERIADVPFALSTALPKDVRRYIGLDQPDDMPVNSHEKFLKSIGQYKLNITRPKITAKIGRQAQNEASLLLSSLQARPSRMPEYLYSSLAPDERDRLILILVLDILDKTCDHPGDYNLLLNRLLPYQVDPGSAEIDFKGGGIRVGVTEQNQQYHHYVGIGAGFPVK